MSSLYALQDEIKNIMDTEFEEADKDKVIEYLSDLHHQRKDKIDALAFVIRQKENEIEFLKSEQALLATKSKSIDNKIKSLKTYIKQVMIGNDLTSIKGYTTTMFLKNTTSVVIDNEEELPDEMVKIELKKTPNKNKIKDSILDNELVKGAHLEYNTSLVIRS